MQQLATDLHDKASKARTLDLSDDALGHDRAGRAAVRDTRGRLNRHRQDRTRGNLGADGIRDVDAMALITRDHTQRTRCLPLRDQPQFMRLALRQGTAGHWHHFYRLAIAAEAGDPAGAAIISRQHRDRTRRIRWRWPRRRDDHGRRKRGGFWTTQAEGNRSD